MPVGGQTIQRGINSPMPQGYQGQRIVQSNPNPIHSSVYVQGGSNQQVDRNRINQSTPDYQNVPQLARVQVVQGRSSRESQENQQDGQNVPQQVRVQERGSDKSIPEDSQLQGFYNDEKK